MTTVILALSGKTFFHYSLMDVYNLCKNKQIALFFKSSRFLVSFFHLNIKASAFGSLVQKIVAESGETMCLINFAFSVKKISYSLRLENVPFLYSNLILLIPSREPIQRRSISMLF